jgi:tetratricopeptide (TPR) repeat protein
MKRQKKTGGFIRKAGPYRHTAVLGRWEKALVAWRPRVLACVVILVLAPASGTPPGGNPRRGYPGPWPGLKESCSMGLGAGAEAASPQTPHPADSNDPQAVSAADSRTAPYEEIAQLKAAEMELAEQIMKDFPDSEEAHIFMGNLYRSRGNSGQALKYWEKAIQVNPRRYDIYGHMAEVALEKGEPEKAITHWKKALQIQPEMVGAHGNIAKALMKLGRHDEAIKELHEEIKLSPNSSLSHYLLGRGYLQQQAYEEARKSFEKAIELQPDHTHAHYGLFTACSRLGQREKAKEHMDTFRRLKAQDMTTIRDRDAIMEVEAYRQRLIRSYIQAEELYGAKRNLQKAEQCLKKALEVDPQNTLCLERLGALFYVTKRLPAALGQFEKVTQLDPNNMACHVNIGSISVRLRQFDKAEKAFEKVIELAPKRSLGYRELARLYLRANVKLADARKLAEQAVVLEPTGSNYHTLGWACDVNKDPAGALRAMQRAIQLEPDNANYRQIYQHIQNRNLKP